MQKIETKKQNKFVKWVSGLSAYTKNKTINTLIFFLAFFIIGGTNYCIMFKVFVPTFFILDFFFMILLVSPIFFFKTTKFDRIYLPILILLLTLFNVFNTCYYQFFGTVFSLKDIVWALENFTQVGLHTSSVQWWVVIVNSLLFILFALGVILYNVLWKFEPTKKELQIHRTKKIAFALSVLFGSTLLFEFSLQMWCIGERNKGIEDIDLVNYSPNYHFNNLGMLGYYVQETRQLTFDKGSSIQTIKDYLTSGNYLQDDYTGLLGTNKPNIMVIAIETGDQCVVNQYTTPNLYKLLNDGVNCNQNYSYNHTNVSDAIMINGNYPQTHFYDWNHFDAPFNLPNILKNKYQYQTYFTHDLVKANDIYHRMKTVGGLGFENCWYHNDVIPEVKPWSFDNSDFTSDNLYISGLLKKIKLFSPNKPFYMHYLTVHMHMDQVLTKYNKQTYEALEKEFGDRLDNPAYGWKNPFKEGTEESKRFRRINLKAMDLDKGIGQLMHEFYETGNSYLNNTLMVVCADHSWYEITSKKTTYGQEIRKIYDINNIKTYQTILGFYHPTLNAKIDSEMLSHKLNKATWPTVVVPTILDLIGDKYNPRMYLNKSIFDKSYDNNEVFYSFWNTRFMNEHFASSDHYHINHRYDTQPSKMSEKMFLEDLDDAKYQLRIIDSIYKKNIFKNHKYDEFMPS